MDNKVSNPKTEVPTTKQMNDKDYLSCILEAEKNIVNNYSYALNEASNDSLYEKIKQIANEASITQRNLFNLMFEKGWYSLEKAEENKINQKHSEYIDQLNQL